MYERLEQRGRIVRQDVSPQEISAALEHAEHDLGTARHLIGTSDDWALTAAHNAVLQAGRALMFATGYRSATTEGHKTVLAFARESLPAHRDLIDYLDRVRVKRNVAVYDSVGLVTRTEAEQAVARAGEFTVIVRDSLGIPREPGGTV